MPPFLARVALLATVAGCAPVAPAAFPPGPGAADASAPVTPWTRPVPPTLAVPAPDAAPMPAMPGMDPGMSHGSHHGSTP
ncbi:hypothetical protein UAJ10_24275 [Nitrospirillum sp. BR 11164]|uniref:hypothetical protein n=1 Tax=Nitrospirillum sp. BR 11164 TaxID=3104324 RepID=UPI002AFFFE81|nr:hypothetical protein [Nitrospirillum sp. BR 11164]MEA1652117.1 hypothetical protein [Nitrospirillum sp. BR 11164]